jgi:two-component system NtrC family sensor kinase
MVPDTQFASSETAPASIHAELVAFAHLNPNPLLLLDPECRLHYCNMAARQVQADFGLSSADMLDVLPDRLPEIVEGCLASPAPQRFEKQIRDRWLGWTAYSVPDGRLVYFHGADITKYKRAEKEQDELRLRLVQSDKMASIGQLAAGIAHEINNPLSFVVVNLNHIGDYSRRLLRVVELQHRVDGPLDGASHDLEPLRAELSELKTRLELDEILEELPALLDESRDGAERIRTIVQNLKEFSHAGEGKQKHADINRCLQSTLKIVAYELKYKAKVIEEYADVPEILCYPQELNQVFMNLLVNAGHAIKEKGEIRVRTSRRDNQIVIAISDTGCGIPPEHLPRIFETFFTTKEVGKGTGLGLSISAEIIKKHHGRIEVESTVGVGTTFHVWLPITKRPDPK